MERTAALALTSRIEATWSTDGWPQSRYSEWIDALESLDEGAAGTAFVRLRASGSASMTIAQFVTAVRALHTVDGGTRPDPCGACSDSGWIEAEDYIEDNGGQPITYSQVKPCACREGKARSESAVWRQDHPRQDRAA